MSDPMRLHTLDFVGESLDYPLANCILAVAMAMQLESNGGSKSRILWIDVCRVLFMFIVVFGHSTDIMPHSSDMGMMRVLNTPFYSYSYPCGIVLMFFFFSGMLNRTSAAWLDWKKFWLFMLPTIVWNMVCLIIKQTYPDTIMGWVGALGVIPDYTSLIPQVGSPSNYPLWFMSVLAYFALVYPMLARIPGKAMMVLLCLLYACAYICVDAKPQDGTAWFLLRESQALGIYLLGIIVSRHGVENLTKWLNKYAWAAALLLFSFSFSLFLPVKHSMLLNGVCSILGVVALCSYGVIMVKCLPRFSAWVAKWASAVFFIYAFHVPFFILLRKCDIFPELPAHTFYMYSLLCYVVSILIFTYLKTRVKWIDRILFMSK